MGMREIDWFWGLDKIFGSLRANAARGAFLRGSVVGVA
jgi:hypothetical protein